MYCWSCGAQNPPTGRYCERCGQPLAADSGPLTYPPTPSPPVAYREGTRLVVSPGARLPAACVKCGQACTTTLQKTFYWHTPWLYLMIFFPGLIFYVIVAIIVRKKIDVAVPICPDHQQRRRTLFMIGGITLAASPFVSIAAGNALDNAGWGFLIFFLLFFGSLAMLAVASSLLSPVYIDAQLGKFKGACEQFLALVPSQAPGA